MYQWCGMGPCANGLKCCVVEWVKRNTSPQSEEFMKKVYASEIENSRRRGRLVVRWKDRVKEYMHERVADRGGEIEQARR